MGFTWTHTCGGPGGSEFRLYGSRLKFIEIWAEDHFVRGARAGLANDQVGMWGTQRGDHHRFDFKDNEKIRDLTLWGDGIGTRFGGMKFTTSAGNEFDARKKNGTTGQTDWVVDVKSGVCIGVTGSSGDDIDCLGLIFVENFKECNLVNLRDHVISSGGSKPIVISNNVWENWGSLADTQEISKETEVEEVETWETTNHWELTLSLTVKGKLGPVDVEAGVSLAFGGSSSHGTSKSQKDTQSWHKTVQVPPGKRVRVEWNLKTYDVVVKTTGDLEFVMDNGETFLLENESCTVRKAGASQDEFIKHEEDLRPSAPPPAAAVVQPNLLSEGAVARLALLGTHGFYLSAKPEATVGQERVRDSWETWTVSYTGDSSFTLRSEHGTFLRMCAGGDGAKVDLAPAAHDWEQFCFEPGPNGKKYLKSKMFKNYISARFDGTVFGQERPQAWEELTVETLN